MSFKHINHFGWIVVGLLVSLVLWGKVDRVGNASSIILGAPTVSNARPTPALSSVRFVDLDVTPTPEAETRTYVVKPGDSLWTIAVKFYGDGTKYVLIQQANDLPPNVRLRNGQVLVIPFLEAERTPTQVPTLPVATPSAPIVPLPTFTPTVLPSASVTAFVTPVPTSLAPTTSSDSTIALGISITIGILNVLSAICFLGSLLCALLSYDLYRRSRRLARRRYISNRVQAGL